MTTTATMITTTTTITTNGTPKVRFKCTPEQKGMKTKKQWDPVATLLPNNPIDIDLPYQCNHFRHYDEYNQGMRQCPNFLDQTQKKRAVERLEEISRKDIRDITQGELSWFRHAFYCDREHEKKQEYRNMDWFEAKFEALIKKKYGTYGVEWWRLQRNLKLYHGPIEETHTWVRLIYIDILPTRKGIHEFIPWPVSGAHYSSVTPDSIEKLYKRTMTTGPNRTELEKLTQGIEFMKSEKRRWAPLQELFGEMKIVIAREGYHCLVADLVEVVWGVIDEMLKTLEDASEEGYFPFNSADSPNREKHLAFERKLRRVI